MDKSENESIYEKYFRKEKIKELEKFAEETVFEEERYIFIRKHENKYFKQKNKYLGYCTHCKKEFVTNLKKHNERNICPKCGEMVTIKNTLYGRKSLINRACFLKFEKSKNDPKNTIVARGYYAERDYSKDYKETKTYFREIGRYIFGPKLNVMLEKGFDWWYKNSSYNNRKWAERVRIGKYNINSMGNFPEYVDIESFKNAIQDTRFKYAKYEKYTYNLTNFMEVYNKYPIIESLEKIGFGNLVKMKVNRRPMERIINWKAKDIFKLLHLNRAEVKEIQQANIEITPDYIKRFRSFKNKKIGLNAEEIYESMGALDRYYYGEDILERVEKYTTWTKMFRYLKKQIEKEREYESLYNGLKDWQDYIKECTELKLDTTKSMTIFPKNLNKAHQNTTKQIKYKKDEEIKRLIKQSLKEREKMKYEYKNLIIRPALDQEELINEGKTLHHCVGGYAANYAKGNTNILFIREKDNIDEPYYTVEVSIKFEVVQIRGKGNKAANEEVRKFMDMYKKEVLEKLSKKNKKNRKVA